MCIELLPLGDNPIAVNKYIILYHRLISLLLVNAACNAKMTDLSKFLSLTAISKKWLKS